jgi:hypothetical protein
VTPEARQVLLRAQESLISGKPIAAPGAARPAPPADEDPLAADVSAALEAMKVAECAFDAFPALRSRIARWELARAAIHAPAEVRGLIEQGIQGRPGAEASLADLTARLRPWWHTQIPSIARACEEVRREAPDSPWRIGARSLLDVVAATELRTMYAREDTAGTVAAMMVPLRSLYTSLQKLVRRVHPHGLPPDSSLAP